MFCRCDSPSPERADGQTLCAECGELVPGPTERLQILTLRRIARLEARLTALENGSGSGPVPRLLTPAQLANGLGRSLDWVYEHTEELGAIRLGSGDKPRIYFNAEMVTSRLNACSDNRRSFTPETPANKYVRRSGRSARAGARADLLPIRGRKAA